MTNTPPLTNPAGEPFKTNEPFETAGEPIEVEQKFYLADAAALQRRLRALAAIDQPSQRHADTYYQHPAKDFAHTREALRIRRIEPLTGNSPPAGTSVTYKGPYAADGVKARPELEWQLEPSDPDGRRLDQLLQHLGFTPVLTVRKTRRPFLLTRDGRQLTVTIDDAGAVGLFAEIEAIADGPAEAAACSRLVAQLAAELGLHQPQPKSYLRMALELAETTAAGG